MPETLNMNAFIPSCIAITVGSGLMHSSPTIFGKNVGVGLIACGVLFTMYGNMEHMKRNK